MLSLILIKLINTYKEGENYIIRLLEVSNR